MERILVFGGTGLVGSGFIASSRDFFETIAPARRHVDLFDEDATRRAVRDVRPDQILFASGYARINDAEREPEKAFALNVRALTWIAEEAAAEQIPLHALSTSAVFSGTNSILPYREEDDPDPVSVYGTTKLEGERIVLDASPSNSVLRLNSVYSSVYAPRDDFARRVVTALRNGMPIQAFTDDVFNPLFLERGVRAIIAALQHRISGVYHLGALDAISNLDFVRLIATAMQADQRLVQPVTLEAFLSARPGMAPRGLNAALDTSKFCREFGDGILATNQQSIHEFIDHLPTV